MQSETSRVQVGFNIYKYLRKFLSTLHGVMIVWIFTLLDELSCVHTKLGEEDSVS